MTDLASNPIYKRMIEGSRGPSARACLLIGVGIALTGNILWFVANIVFYDNGGFVGWVCHLMLRLIDLLQPWQPLVLIVAMVITEHRTALHISGGELAVVRASDLTEQEIVRGYLEGARYRLRLWISVGSGLLAAFLMGRLIWFSMILNGSLPSNFSPDNLLRAVRFTAGDPMTYVWILLIALTLVAIDKVLWPLILTAGVWAALRNPRGPIPLSYGLVVILAVYTVIAVFVIYGLLSAAMSPLFWLMFSWASLEYIILGMIIPYIALRLLRADCVRLIEQDSTKEVTN